MKSAFLTLCFVLASCGQSSGGGSDDKTETSPMQSAQLVQALTDLPDCDDASQGALVYVKESGSFSTCDAGEWSVVDIKGADGADGKNGKNGTDASSNHIAKSYSCFGELASTGILAKYTASEMANGDLFVYASLSNPLYETGSSIFYSSAQNGASDGSVIIISDLNGANTYGSWELTMNRTTEVMTAVYNDTGDAMDGTSYTLQGDDCSSNDY